MRVGVVDVVGDVEVEAVGERRRAVREREPGFRRAPAELDRTARDEGAVRHVDAAVAARPTGPGDVGAATRKDERRTAGGVEEIADAVVFARNVGVAAVVEDKRRTVEDADAAGAPRAVFEDGRGRRERGPVGERQHLGLVEVEVGVSRARDVGEDSVREDGVPAEDARRGLRERHGRAAGVEETVDPDRSGRGREDLRPGGLARECDRAAPQVEAAAPGRAVDGELARAGLHDGRRHAGRCRKAVREDRIPRRVNGEGRFADGNGDGEGLGAGGLVRDERVDLERIGGAGGGDGVRPDPLAEARGDEDDLLAEVDGGGAARRDDERVAGVDAPARVAPVPRRAPQRVAGRAGPGEGAVHKARLDKLDGTFLHDEFHPGGNRLAGVERGGDLREEGVGRAGDERRVSRPLGDARDGEVARVVGDRADVRADAGDGHGGAGGDREAGQGRGAREDGRAPGDREGAGEGARDVERSGLDGRRPRVDVGGGEHDRSRAALREAAFALEKRRGLERRAGRRVDDQAVPRDDELRVLVGDRGRTVEKLRGRRAERTEHRAVERHRVAAEGGGRIGELEDRGLDKAVPEGERSARPAVVVAIAVDAARRAERAAVDVQAERSARVAGVQRPELHRSAIEHVQPAAVAGIARIVAQPDGRGKDRLGVRARHDEPRPLVAAVLHADDVQHAARGREDRRAAGPDEKLARVVFVCRSLSRAPEEHGVAFEPRAVLDRDRAVEPRPVVAEVHAGHRLHVGNVLRHDDAGAGNGEVAAVGAVDGKVVGRPVGRDVVAGGDFDDSRKVQVDGSVDDYLELRIADVAVLLRSEVEGDLHGVLAERAVVGHLQGGAGAVVVAGMRDRARRKRDGLAALGFGRDGRDGQGVAPAITPRRVDPHFLDGAGRAKGVGNGAVAGQGDGHGLVLRSGVAVRQRGVRTRTLGDGSVVVWIYQCVGGGRWIVGRLGAKDVVRGGDEAAIPGRCRPGAGSQRGKRECGEEEREDCAFHGGILSE